MNLIRIWGIVFILLWIFTIPFPLNSILNPVYYFEAFFSGLEQEICYFLGLNFQFSGHFYSDSIDLQVHVIFLVILALLSSIGIQKFSKINNEKVSQMLLLISSYTLAFFLLKYGCDKLFKLQFYYPEPNILHSEFGNLDLDILYWSTIGKSHSYNIFLGLIEIIPAFLLFFARTRKLAACIAFAVLIHVLMINISYHIEVKILSSFLIFLSIIILANYWKSLFTFFFLNKIVSDKETTQIFKNQKLKHFIKFSVIFFICLESSFFAFSTGIYNGDHKPKIKEYGAYALEYYDLQLNKQFHSEEKFKRFYIHSKNYIIFENEKGEMLDFKFKKINRTFWIEVDKKLIQFNFNKSCFLMDKTCIPVSIKSIR